ncbi:DNA-processing protein DprA [Microaerobacter geothermalis]|uniref:DNA-processing protein DprA n=1 Tax=Microaerobacter geothermalis TaxID=674972 RepID=UPI001F1A7E90|nr:DNA-processing protein DprA [Microaerobacter geothermalis]MCF6093850.1 DNA-processing protein DprA [Microaerobacter geothermalis]
MITREELIYLHQVKGIGWKTIKQLIESPYEREEWKHWNPDRLSSNLQISSKMSQLLLNQDFNDHKLLEEQYDHLGIKVITIWDDFYPDLLKEINQPPWVLYAIGNDELLQKEKIAVVGTRKATPYGKDIAKKLGQYLTKHDVVVVSGMAIGIDTEAHLGALMENGKTIAVLGCGINVIYPSANRHVYQKISKVGLILSEYPPGWQPAKGMFPQRNRIISGLSRGVVVVEAAAKSGSLITADLAIDQNREVFAIPGPLLSPQSVGPHQLINQGAKIVTHFQDIVQHHSFYPDGGMSDTEHQDILTEEEKKLLNVIPYHPISIDHLVSDFGTVQKIYPVLLSLEMKGKIVKYPGSFYSRT